MTDRASSLDLQLRQLLARAGRPLPEGWPAERPLELDSLTVVTLHDQLERAFGLRIRASEVTEESFGSLAALRQLMAPKIDGGEAAP